VAEELGLAAMFDPADFLAESLRWSAQMLDGSAGPQQLASDDIVLIEINEAFAHACGILGHEAARA
jgi:hypothetical protein